MDKKHIEFLLGNNANYYLNHWLAVTDLGRRNTWNFSALFFSIFWLAYRKMYVYASFFSFIFLCNLFIQLAFQLNTITCITMDLMFPAGIGFFGNRIYQYFLEMRLIQFYAEGLPEPMMEQQMRDTGGTEFASGFGFFIILSILVYLLFCWFNLVPEAYTPLNLLRG